jgi:hypothetical protein
MYERGLKWLAGNILAGLVGSGALALLATLIGFWSSLESPWNYTFAYGMAALALAAVIWHIKRYGLDLPPPWGKFYWRGTRQEYEAISAHGVASTPNEGFPIVGFDLRGQMNQRVPTGGRARAVEFLQPTHKIVKGTELPEVVRWRLRTIAIVKGFTEDEMILDSRVQKVHVSAQIHLAEGSES